MHKFKDLNVWKKGQELVKVIYEVTANFPKDEIFGITSQIRRSAVSIPANIAEGCGRHTDKELCRFLYIANGSAFELETLMILSKDLNFIDDNQFHCIDCLLQEIQKMIYNFKRSKE